MQTSRDERAWHLRNVVETTKGRDLIRQLYQELSSKKTAARSKTTNPREPQLDEMIEAILKSEYPG